MQSNILIKRYKVALFIAALLPVARLAWLAATDGLSANPVEFVIHSLGTWTLLSLLVTLAFTPLRLLAGIAWPLQLRRMCGLSSSGFNLWWGRRDLPHQRLKRILSPNASVHSRPISRCAYTGCWKMACTRITSPGDLRTGQGQQKKGHLAP